MTPSESSVVRLGNISEMRLGLSLSVSDSGNIPMIRVGDLVRPIRWQDVQRAQVRPNDIRDFLLRDGDVLLARSGVGSVGNVQVAIDPPTAVFASYVIRIRPLHDWHGPYICYYLKSPMGRHALHSRAQGATIVNLSTSRISSIEIPEVSLSEQGATAARLQAAETAYLSTEDKLAQGKAGIEQLKRQLYASAIEASEVSEDADSWDVSDLPSITDNLDRARVPLNEDMRRQISGNIPYYGASGIIDHVNDSTHEGTHVLISEDGNNLLSRRSDIAFVASGRFWANNHVHILRPHNEILPEFLALQINSLDLSSLVTGTAQPKLPQTTLNTIAVRVPSLDVQRTILRAATELENTYDRLLDNQKLVTSNLSAAWAEVLDDAFRFDRIGVRTLDLEEASEWLDEVAPMLRSMVSEKKSTGPSASPRRPAEVQSGVSSTPTGWLAVRQLFSMRYPKVVPDELDDMVDDFYGWLKASLRSGEVDIRRDGEETYLRIRP